MFGVVDVERPNLADIDPTLEGCCLREEEELKYKEAVEETLQRNDRIALAERRRRNVIENMSFGSGCRCCYDHEADGGEYFALAKARDRLNRQATKLENQIFHNEDAEENNEPVHDDDDYYRSGDEYENSESDDSEFDYLLDEDLPDDNDIARIQENRLAEIQLAAVIRESQMQHGFGVHRQMSPSRLFKAAGLGSMDRTETGIKHSHLIPPACVLHLYLYDSDMSANLDLCLEGLAEKRYRGTKFMRAAGRATLIDDADFTRKIFPALKPESDLPALVAVKDGSVIAVCPTLSGLGNSRDDTIETNAVEEWLDKAGVLLEEVPTAFEDICRIRPEEEALMDVMMKEKAKLDELNEEIFNCGVPGCEKTFHHEHIGIKNEEQSGLLVTEEDVTRDQ